MSIRLSTAVLTAALLVVASTPAAAQSTPARVMDASSAVEAPRRSRDGRLEIVAIRADRSPRVDGVLDDDVWRDAPPVTGFVQSDPYEGRPASERTEVRVAFDSQNLYIAAWLHDSEPDGLVVSDIRKDFREEEQDGFAVILDTFGDRRNGYVFLTTPEGARGDRQMANEGREVNASWDAVWTVRTRRVSGGWTVEMAIPFRALRFDPNTDRAWGINFSRRIRRKNEISFWSPVPRGFNLYRVSLAGDLAGLATGSGGRDLRVKPYVAARTVRETGGPRYDKGGDAGADLKYGVTPSLTLDLTLNPDFAQAEADEQQVNLSQFSQFFPEKREFFLENSGIFYVGDAARNNRAFAPPTPDEDLLLFHSRRIGLTSDGRALPIIGGARLTGKTGGFTVGALSMQTQRQSTSPATNYTVLRARRNLGSGSDFGLIAMQRQATDRPDDWNRVAGVDGNVRFLRRVDWNSYLIATDRPEGGREQYAARTSLMFEGGIAHIKTGVMRIGEDFTNELGYYRRTGIEKWFLDAGVRPRPAFLARLGVRELHPHVTWNYFENGDSRMISRRLHHGFTVRLNNGAWSELSYNPEFQLLTQPFLIDRSVGPIPAGDYGWKEWQLRIVSDASRRISGSVNGTAGGLWSGTQRGIGGNVTFRPDHRARLTAGVQRTAVDLRQPDASFTRTLATLRGSYSFTTTMFVDGLSQYDPRRKLLNANVRFNLIHRPLSDVFVVFNEQRFMLPGGPAPGRSVVIKYTQMMAF